MSEWWSDLNQLGDVREFADDLKPLIEGDDGEAYSTTTYGHALDADAIARTHVDHHRFLDAQEAESLATALGSLPGERDAYHLWVGWRHSMGHVLAAVLRLADPATIDTLYVATLTYSAANAEELAAYLDAGKVKRLTLLTSHYFAKTSPQIFDPTAAYLRARGSTVGTARSHTKIIAMKLTDGRYVTATGSANLRSAKTAENVELFGSPDVYAFHAARIDYAIGAG